MYERRLVKDIRERMGEKRRFLQIVTGPRQSGKTTAVTQALEAIKTPYHYISADDPAATAPEWLSNEWDHVRLQQKQTGKEIVFAVDEIQKIKNWSAVVKKYWDEDTRKKLPIKVILTGSSSLLIQKGLAGTDTEPKGRGSPLSSLMGRFEVLFSPHWNYTECREAFRYTLDDFLFFGGYPGAAELVKDETRWARYIGSSIVEPTISNDILMMEPVQKPALLRSLFNMGAMYSAQEMSYTKIMGQLQDAGNTVTIAHYLNLLEKASMICGLQKYSANKSKTRQSSPRLMVFDTALMTYSEGASRKQLLSDPGKKGHLVESAVGAYLLARSKEEGFEVFWWRDRESEVDFVIQKNDKLTAFEVKSGKVKHTGGALEFKKRHPQALLYIIGSPDCGLEGFLSGKFDLFN